jgi:hypothetical protein
MHEVNIQNIIESNTTHSLIIYKKKTAGILSEILFGMT